MRREKERVKGCYWPQECQVIVKRDDRNVRHMGSRQSKTSTPEARRTPSVIEITGPRTHKLPMVLERCD